MQAPITRNEELAAATDHGELKFVFMLALPPSWKKDRSDDLIRPSGQRVN